MTPSYETYQQRRVEAAVQATSENIIGGWLDKATAQNRRIAEAALQAADAIPHPSESELVGVIADALGTIPMQIMDWTDPEAFRKSHERTAAVILQALRPALAGLAGGGWQTIETAPKDGTRVLVRNGDKGGYCTEPYDIGVASWGHCLGTEQWGSTACCDGVTYFKPTHWQPLPPAPAAKGGE